MRSVKAPARASRHEKQIVYDLQKHWQFWKDSGGGITLEELERLSRTTPGISGQAILGDPLRTKPIRVLVAMSGEGLSLWDVQAKVSHRWADRTAPFDCNEFAALLKTLG